MAELRCSFPDEWCLLLFTALCMRHGVKPIRKRGQRKTAVTVRVQEKFFYAVVYSEYKRLLERLRGELKQATYKLIHDEVFTEDHSL
jgi:hypothetical protein